MIIKTKSPKEFAPSVVLRGVFVVDSEGTKTTQAHRDITYEKFVGSVGHYDYTCDGSNVSALSVYSQAPANSIDMSAFPTLRRNTGVNSRVSAMFGNGRGITEKTSIGFNDISAHSYAGNVQGVVTGSYAEYSLGRVNALFSAMNGPRVFDDQKNRNQLSSIPHEHLTGHAFGGPRPPVTGLRFSAITPRHMIGVAHYGYNLGDKIFFKTVNNQVVEKTVVGRWSANDFVTGWHTDISFYLLDEDLPTTIKPFPIVGEWIKKIQAGSTSSDFTICPQFYGMKLWNMDGHLTPGQCVYKEDLSVSNANTYSIDGIEVGLLDSFTLKELTVVTHSGYEFMDYSSINSEFYHARRGGDSGSPCLAPIDDGWALCSLVSGSMWSENLMNEAIARLDYIAGVSTGLTVTVAPDPTL
jgi:hypothetical protein